VEFHCLLPTKNIYWHVNGVLVVANYPDLVVNHNTIRINNVGPNSQGYFECGIYHGIERSYAPVAVGILLVRGKIFDVQSSL